MIAVSVISMITALAEPTAISLRLKVNSYMKFDGSQAEPPGPPLVSATTNAGYPSRPMQ